MDICYVLTLFQISLWATKVSVPKGICSQSTGGACWWSSSFEWLHWQAGGGRLESKAAVLLPLLFNFSSLPLKWYCGTHEPETELIMNSQETPNVQFSQISPWSDFGQVLNPDGGKIFAAGFPPLTLQRDEYAFSLRHWPWRPDSELSHHCHRT